METPTKVGVCQRTLQVERRRRPGITARFGCTGLRQVRPGSPLPKRAVKGDQRQLRSACGARSALESVMVVVDGELVVLDELLGVL